MDDGRGEALGRVGSVRVGLVARDGEVRTAGVVCILGATGFKCVLVAAEGLRLAAFIASEVLLWEEG